ncbi:carboxymuconolactone decarboxylase family protein [Exilibacterium tricleocarpae]|uniref:Carboxymuconolactone decarboxylase family protein n=1 Tax=Exilibacterium tricleocarpae TaxID=2591008 RepID=A0A545TNS1_9GAMM|nr:carboxymuconolactone decarboxylase family protein [Exilibacterium tricleocarpae]TQV78869.1 carboxymuconolactone decarboxylase family protein [Exilibacterium tricleocarpae]
MSQFPLHTADSAPQDSKPLLDNSRKAFGMLPNLHAVMAEAPGLLAAYQQAHSLFQDSSFNDAELTVVWQSINVEHECHYCVPAHTAIANKAGVDPAITEALRSGTALPEKLEALRTFTLKMVRQRGRVEREDIDAFTAAGYTKRQVLEIILGISQKVMSNYTNHIADTPVDAPFEQFAWSR